MQRKDGTGVCCPRNGYTGVIYLNQTDNLCYTTVAGSQSVPNTKGILEIPKTSNIPLNIEWKTTNTSSCVATGGVGAWTSLGTTNIAPSGAISSTFSGTSNQTYTLTCQNSAGATVTKNFTVNYGPAVTVVTPPTTTSTIVPTIVSKGTTPAGYTCTTITPPTSTTGAVYQPSPNWACCPNATPTYDQANNACKGSGSSVPPPPGPGGIGIVTPPTTSATPTPTPTLPPGGDGTSVIGPANTGTFPSPYTFVFGVNQAGNLDFKILKTSNTEAFTLFSQVSGSISELNTTKSNLTAISANVPSTSLADANYSVEIDTVALSPEPCQLNTPAQIAAHSDPDYPKEGVDCSNLNMLEVTQAGEINVLLKKVKFSDVGYYNDFATLSRDLIVGQNSFGVFFGKNNNDKSIGSVGDGYVQSEVINSSLSTSTVGSSYVIMGKSGFDPKPPVSKTPILDLFFGGICGPLATLRSLTSTLHLPVPAGYPTPYVTDSLFGKEYNLDYLEKFLESSGGRSLTAFGGVIPSQIIKMYQAYAVGYDVTEEDFSSPISLEKQKAIQKKIATGKTDCSLFTTAHMSHISGVKSIDISGKNSGSGYKMFKIEVDDGLHQGDAIVNGVQRKYPPQVFSGSTIFLLDEDGKLISIYDHSNNIAYWSNKSWGFLGFSNSDFSSTAVRCYTISKKTR